MSYREETQAALSCGWETALKYGEDATVDPWETWLWFAQRRNSDLSRDAALNC